MKPLSWMREKYIYIVVLILLLALLAVMYVFQQGGIDSDSTRVYLEALTGVATLALLYYAYFNVASRKEEDIAHLELAVRPIFIWELESRNGGARLDYKTIKHPIYDMHAVLSMGGQEMQLEERHLDVAEAGPGAERRVNVSSFISGAMGKEGSRILRLDFVYHSEVGGKYEIVFTKEVVKKPHGFLFQHRNIISAKYPWRREPVTFE